MLTLEIFVDRLLLTSVERDTLPIKVLDFKLFPIFSNIPLTKSSSIYLAARENDSTVNEDLDRNVLKPPADNSE